MLPMIDATDRQIARREPRRVEATAIILLTITVSACAPRVSGASPLPEPTFLESLVWPATVAAQIIIFVCVLAIGIAALIAIVLSAICVFHSLWDKAFGECNNCKQTSAEHEAKEVKRQAEVERIIREHDRETSPNRPPRHQR